MNPDGFSTVRFSTSDLPEKDRVAMWRDHYCRIVMKLDIEPMNDAPLECAILARALPGVQVMSTSLSPARLRRTREFLADEFVLRIPEESQDAGIPTDDPALRTNQEDGEVLM